MRPFKVVIIQDDRLLIRLEARSRTTTQSDQSSESGGENTGKRSREKTRRRECIRLDTTKVFEVLLFRHKLATQLAAGFWHTERIDQRQRIGNALDRSPRTIHEQSMKEFPFGKKPSLRDGIIEEFSSEYVFCGCLQQKGSHSRGRYTLRISPMSNAAKEEYVFDVKYKDAAPHIEDLTLEDEKAREGTVDPVSSAANTSASIYTDRSTNTDGSTTPVLLRTESGIHGSRIQDITGPRAFLASRPVFVSQKRKLYGADSGQDPTVHSSSESPPKRTRPDLIASVYAAESPTRIPASSIPRNAEHKRDTSCHTLLDDESKKCRQSKPGMTSTNAS